MRGALPFGRLSTVIATGPVAWEGTRIESTPVVLDGRGPEVLELWLGADSDALLSELFFVLVREDLDLDRDLDFFFVFFSDFC